MPGNRELPKPNRDLASLCTEGCDIARPLVEREADLLPVGYFQVVSGLLMRWCDRLRRWYPLILWPYQESEPEAPTMLQAFGICLRLFPSRGCHPRFRSSAVYAARPVCEHSAPRRA